NLKDDAGAKKAYDRLVELSQTDSKMMNWQHTPEMTKKLIAGDIGGAAANGTEKNTAQAKKNLDDATIAFSDYDYRFTSVETTALAL
ncbi:hypothetical protein ABTA78_19625, partial [Acinetobacter baumannii]